MPRRIIASNRSPMDYQTSTQQAPAVGGLVQAMLGCLREDDLWVAASQGKDDPNRMDPHSIVPVPGERPFRMKKIFLDSDLYHEYYDGMANSFLWPLLHCNGAAYYEISRTFPRPRFDGNDFSSYSLVNRIFAKAVLDELQKDSLVWLQDYHLLLTPALIRERHPAVSIGQFVHIPFFRIHVVERYLKQNGKAREGVRYFLDGMLANDLLGFHIPEYAENFASAVEYFFSPSAKVEQQNVAGRKSFAITFGHSLCMVEDFPIGVDTMAVGEQSIEPLHYELPEGGSLEGLVQETRQQGKALFVGLERCDYTKGLVERFAILDELLSRGLLLQYIGVIETQSRQQVDAYQELVGKVQKEEKRLNHKWKRRLDYEPFRILYQGIPPPQNYALLRQADCVLISVLEDGMNLVFNEAVIAKHDLPYSGRGFIAVGNCGAEKVASSYGEQHGLLRIDPLDYKESARRILRSFRDHYTVSDALVAHVFSLDVNNWRDGFLRRLEEVKGGK